jgi:hypothetical protein
MGTGHRPRRILTIFGNHSGLTHDRERYTPIIGTRDGGLDNVSEGLMITYCVICREGGVSLASKAPMIRFYLSSATADRGILTTEAETPQCRVLGIEPVARDDSQAA